MVASSGAYRAIPTMSTMVSSRPNSSRASRSVGSTCGAVADVRGRGHAVDLARDVGGRVGVGVEAPHLRTALGERVRDLTADPLARSGHDDPAAVEPEEPGVVGDRRGVETPRGGGTRVLAWQGRALHHRGLAHAQACPAGSSAGLLDGSAT